MAILPLQLARVSNLLRANTSTAAISRAQQKLLETQNQLVTGNRLNTPSDDPGDSAVSMQLQKLLEKRGAFADNLSHAQSQLSEVDSTLGDLTGLLQEAQQIASANVGSDVTADERLGAAAVIKSITSQALSLSNKQFEGVFIFAGDKSTDPPFAEDVGGVKFVGDSNLLKNVYDDNTALPFMVDGAQVFGALSTRVQSAVDVSPALTAQTRATDLRGATNAGVRLGSIQIGNGITSQIIDLAEAGSVQDVINTINAAGIGGVTAGIAPDGNSLLISAGAGDDVSITEVGGGRTASDLGILRVTPLGAGVALDGGKLGAKITDLSTLASLNGGAGIDLSGLVLTNGTAAATIDLSTAVTVEDLLNAVNGSPVGVKAQINSAGTGIDLVNPTQGVAMTIGENGGTTAADLGIRSLSPATALSELNNGKGISLVTGADLQVTRRDGTSFQVDLGAAQTIQDVIDAINTADAGGGVAASFASTGNGLVLTDTTGGAAELVVSSLNFSTSARDLGLDVAAAGVTLAGRDTNAIEAAGVFANLKKLQTALQTSDQNGITAAAEGLKADYDRIVRSRGEVGARVQELEHRQNRLEDENLATKGLLSKLKEVDFTQAISEFNTLQTALQASMMTTSRVLNLSLMDFLG